MTEVSSAEEMDNGCRIRLLSLHCIKTEDWGADEAYLIINSTETEIFSINNGVTKDLSSISPIYCNGVGTIKLYDYDNGRNDLFDSDDFLGRRTVRCEEANKGTQYAYFTQDGANYKLEYEVYR